MRFSVGGAPGESPNSQKKAVRVLTNDADGNITIETASPPASQVKNRIQSPEPDMTSINELDTTPDEVE